MSPIIKEIQPPVKIGDVLVMMGRYGASFLHEVVDIKEKKLGTFGFGGRGERTERELATRLKTLLGSGEKEELFRDRNFVDDIVRRENRTDLGS